MASLAEELADLRQQIAEAEQRLSDAQLKIVDTKVDIASIVADYERIVWPYQSELQEVKQKITDLRGYSDQSSRIPGLPDDYIPANEQFRRAFHPKATDRLPDIEAFQPRTGLSRDDAGLKKLYRTLALKYHPDLAPDEETRERWTGFMKQINSAYADGDSAKLDALGTALAREAPPPVPKPDQSESASAPMALALVPDEDEVSAARSRLDALSVALQNTEAGLFDLQFRWEMKLKKEVDRAHAKGRNLFDEIAIDLQQQLQKAKSDLASLGRI